MKEALPQSRVLRVLVASACVVVLIAALRAAAPILVPFVLALFVAVASLPLLAWFRRLGVPNGPSVLLIVLLDAALLAALAWIVAVSAAQVTAELPHYKARLDELEVTLLAFLQSNGVAIAALPYADLVQPERLVQLASALLRGLTDVVSAGFLVLLFLVFILAEAAGFGDKLRAAVGARAADFSHLTPIVHEVQAYLALKTAVSLLTGLLVWTAATLLGVDFALFWGLLAFLLNYVPNIGSILAAVPAIGLALLQLGPGTALALAAVYLGVNLVLGNIVEPALMGRRLGLSTLVVLISLVFWGWVWGIPGMLLSLPLTMAAKIALEGSSELRWIAVLLGPAPPGASAPALAASLIAPAGGGEPAPAPALAAAMPVSPAAGGDAASDR
jgi:AI-2 transport protein TqsA